MRLPVWAAKRVAALLLLGTTDLSRSSASSIVREVQKKANRILDTGTAQFERHWQQFIVVDPGDVFRPNQGRKIVC